MQVRRIRPPIWADVAQLRPVSAPIRSISTRIQSNVGAMSTIFGPMWAKIGLHSKKLQGPRTLVEQRSVLGNIEMACPKVR